MKPGVLLLFVMRSNIRRAEKLLAKPIDKLGFNVLHS